MKVSFIANHYFFSPRKAGMARLAQSAYDQGHDVQFFVAGKSIISERRDFVSLFSAVATLIKGPGPKIQRAKHAFISQYIIMKVLHPLPKRAPRVIRSWILRTYNVLPEAILNKVSESDVIFIESGFPVLYTKIIKENFPNIALIYRVSDDMDLFFRSPELLELENKYEKLFDLISFPSKILRAQKKFDNPNCFIHSHGVPGWIKNTHQETSSLDKSFCHIAVLGGTLGDNWVINEISNFNECWVHIFSKKKPESQGNFTFYGEKDLEDAVEVIKNCDVALSHYKYLAGAEYLSETSNKNLIYRSLRLPILIPSHLYSDQTYMFPYTVGDTESLKNALFKARKAKHSHQSLEVTAKTWDEVFSSILDDLMLIKEFEISNQSTDGNT